jgi:hypothetical protein
MGFYKKVLVVKQLEKGYSTGGRQASGIFRIETENGVSNLFLSLVNLSMATSGEYFAFVLDGGGRLYDFSLGSRPDFITKTFPHTLTDDNLSVGIVLVDSFVPITVAFATTLSSQTALTDFKKAVADFLCAKLRANKKKEEKDLSDDAFISQKSTVTKEQEVLYNDEAVATENYFDFEDVKEKLSKIKEFDDEQLRLENELPYSRGKEKAQESQADDCRAYDETNQDQSNEFSKTTPYYLTVEGELEELFNKFPEETELKKTFLKSRFVKVFYSNTKYYVVGVIKENDQIKYICYGVPATYSKEPPKELKGFCSFIPLSIFSLLGDGYWMMFQDAITGKCVKPN